MDAETAAGRAAPLAPRAVADLPLAHRRPTGMDDLSFLRELEALGPVIRDRHGLVLSWSAAHLARSFDPRDTRQIELETYQMQGLDLPPIKEMFEKSILYANPPRHQARRAPLAKAFAHPMIKAMRPEIRRTARALIEPHLGAPETDFLAAVASAMPARMIASILGLPQEDAPRFTELVYSSIRALSFRSLDVLAQASADLGELNAYVDALIAERRAHPRDDFLTDYLARVGETDLDEGEIRSQIATLVSAGADTTRLTLAMTVARLIEHPAQWALLRADPDGMKRAAAQEGLRFDPAVASKARIVSKAFELGGALLTPGTVFSPSIILAQRDPAVYADPDRFDITRQDHPPLHPAFGGGAHRCLGEALAWAELEETLAALAELVAAPEFVGPPPGLKGLGAVREITPMRVRLS